ncbi:DUF547 domain-containing protein [Mesonia aquimarina]|uniref:DUF547 domain-containing protein n=1 Tax=Mesonia aquimarina TaxID=1504967 RepID=UPI000EF5E590|nr:DUF547 domain-containing protein [Mesonia aquimarina]
MNIFNNFTKLLFFSPFLLMIACGSSKKEEQNLTAAQEKINPIEISKDFFDAVKQDKNAEKYKEKLAQISPEVLQASLKNDQLKKAFWLNIYNTYVQYLLKKNPDLYEDRSAFFSEDRFTIAGEKMSLDDVEHGMIRDSRVKLSLGHIKDPFASKFEKKLRVSEVDWRIHFALNCGAKSCPPVRYYSVKNLDEELEQSAKTYLTKEVTYKKEEEKVFVPRLMDWFRADFEGKDGVIEILKNYQLIPQSSDPDVEFSDYDWTLDVNNYQ